MTARTGEGAHTAGPWYVFGDDESGGVPFVEVSRGECGTPDYVSIAHVQADMDDDDEFFLSEENHANARLIAAAPDLLEACKAQRTLIEDMARFVGQMALKDYALFNDAPIAADRAIAKAEGTSP